MRKTRCKFKLRAIRPDGGGNVSVSMMAISDGDKSVAEDEAFTRYTPSGELQFQVTNPAVIDMFVGKEGALFYVDVIPCDQKAEAAIGDGGSPSADYAAQAGQKNPNYVDGGNNTTNDDLAADTAAAADEAEPSITGG